MAEAEEAIREGEPSPDVRVLVVDDDVDYAELTATYLQREPAFSVTTAFGGRDALDRLDPASLPDCVVSDHDMPGMNGLEFLAAVRDEHPQLPFILFTGKGNEEIASDAVSAGVTDYVKKGGPEQYDVLANRVRNAVDRRRSQQALREEKELLEQVLATTSGSIVCARSGEITFATRRAADTLGVEQASLVGADWDDPDHWQAKDVHENPFPPNEKPMERVFDGAHVEAVEISIVDGNGDRRFLSIDAAPLREADGTIDRAVVSLRDITDRITRERELATSRQKYQSLIEALPDAVILIDDETERIVDANGKAGVLLERDPEDVLGMHVTDIHPELDSDRYERLFREGLPRTAGAEASARRFDDGTPVEVVTASGSRVPVEVRASVLQLDDETVVQGVFRDLSDETERQRELERSRTVLDAVGDATYALDEDGCFTYANDAMAELAGYSVDEIVGEHCSLVMGDAHVEEGTELIRTLLRENRSRGMARMTVERKDGEHVDVENHIALLPSDGEFRGTAGIARDVTDRVEQERRLRESEQKYASVVQEANDGVVIAQDGVLKFLNPKACSILNADEHDLLGQQIHEVVSSEDRGKVEDRLRRRLAGEDPERRYEFTALALDGEQIPIEFTASVITYDGAPAVLAICRDIRERKQRERELEQYETIVQTAPDGVFIVDEQANYTGGNMSGAELTGYSQQELMGKDVPELVEEGVFGPEVVPRYEATVQHLLSSSNDDEKGTFEFTITRSGESRIYECHVSLRPFDPAAGESFRGSIGVLRDVTERKRRQRDLERQNERLEDFTNVIGHDLRNPLNVAAGTLELARESGDEEQFDRVGDAHERIEEILDDLLTLARTGQVVDDTEPVSLHELARTAWGTVDTADASLELGADLDFRADPGRIRQLLENLYANAVAHAGSDVAVTVDTIPEGGFVVADTGPGIPDDVVDSVFEPGFSTRLDGTGFGLAIVADVAESHGWEARIGAGEQGTRIEIRF